MFVCEKVFRLCGRENIQVWLVEMFLNGWRILEWSSYIPRIQTPGEKSGIHQTVHFHPINCERVKYEYGFLDGRRILEWSSYTAHIQVFEGRKRYTFNYSFFVRFVMKIRLLKIWLWKRLNMNWVRILSRRWMLEW